MLNYKDYLTTCMLDADVCCVFRSTLQEEVNLLLEDISFLQQCLDDEASFRAGGGLTLAREPTLTG